MATGRISVTRFETNSETTNSLSETTTANSSPAKSPGRRSGSVTRRKTRHGVAPRLAAARSSAGSRLRTLTHTERTTNGSTSATWAAISTLRLRSRPERGGQDQEARGRPPRRARRAATAAPPPTRCGRAAGRARAPAPPACRSAAPARRAPPVTRGCSPPPAGTADRSATFSYQRSEKPAGGNDRIAVGLNETTITTTVGSVMNARSATTARRSDHAASRPPTAGPPR